MDDLLYTHQHPKEDFHQVSHLSCFASLSMKRTRMQRLQYAAAPAEGDIISGQHENNPSFTAPETYFIFSLLITDFSALNIFKYIISPAGNATSVRFKL